MTILEIKKKKQDLERLSEFPKTAQLIDSRFESLSNFKDCALKYCTIAY